MTPEERKEAVDEFVALCAESFRANGAIRLSEPELTILLLGTAITLGTRRVGKPWDPIDEISCYAWWDISNALTRETRVAIHTTMQQMGVPFPPHPGDVIERRVG